MQQICSSLILTCPCLITIYPNPATDQIIINQGEQSDMRYSIYDAQGRIALSQTVAEPHQNMIWDISSLSSGLYVLSISQKGKNIKSVQLVVQ
ncbi:MAG: T9SS type A sorting domain-containing protein [Saprospiraceae bacterium]|nr:T9SS type A sorting domain-containing protein [Saprospiraceae bacterium]